MAITTTSGYRTQGGRLVDIAKSLTSYTANKWYSLWLNTPGAGAAPSTAATCDSTTAGGIPGVPATSSSSLWLRSTNFVAGDGAFTLILCDRLSHQGGLSGDTAAPQATNLPTAALTRYTDGAGVMAMVECYSAIGATPTTFSISYTDQDGNSGTSPLSQAIGGTGDAEAGRMWLVPLAAGDSGVRAAANLTLTGATGTAGNLGITLFKPLGIYSIGARTRKGVDFDEFYTKFRMTEIEPGACLTWLQVSPSLAGLALSQAFGQLDIIEG